MQFSTYFGIEPPDPPEPPDHNNRGGQEDQVDWFDPILDTDTRLFVDPFLIFKETTGPWATAHDELIGYFDRVFKQLSGHEDNPRSLQYRRDVTLMEFPEPQEFCLGYAATGTRDRGPAPAWPSGPSRRCARRSSGAWTTGWPTSRSSACWFL